MDSTEKNQLSGLGAGGLLLLVLVLSVVNPGIVVATTFLALVIVFGMKNWIGLVVAGVAGIVATGVPDANTLWYLERGWAVLLAGGFITLTMTFPNHFFIDRAIGTLFGIFMMLSVPLALHFHYWSIIDETINQEIMGNIQRSIEFLGEFDTPAIVQQDLAETAMVVASYQHRLFPALVGLSSLASVAVAWWGYIGLSGKKFKNLVGLTEFNFNDHWVWLLISGLLFLVMDFGDGWSRLGENLLVFMMGLYFLRGIGVVLVTTSMLFLGKIGLFFGFIFLGPVLMTAMFLVGLSDTWFDYRKRVRMLRESKQ